MSYKNINFIERIYKKVMREMENKMDNQIQSYQKL